MYNKVMFNGSDKYYCIETDEAGVALCFIDIHAFMRAYMPEIDVADFRRSKNVFFKSSGCLALYFNEQDFEKINRFKVLKKQVEWMAGKAAVKRLAVLACAENENALIIKAEAGGAPYLENYPDFPISISHSGRFAVAAAGTAVIDVAVDIEIIEKDRMQSIGRVAFSRRELEELKGRSNEAHYLWWTVKESYLKIIGKGFAEGLKKVEFLKGCVFHHGKKIEDITIDSKIIYDDYAFTLICRLRNANSII